MEKFLEVKSKEQHISILSIDGGGIRGIIPAILVQNIEERIKVLTRNPNAKIADYFDLITGTSTGGILAAYYLHPDYGKDLESTYKSINKRQNLEAKNAALLYKNHAKEIFPDYERKSAFQRQFKYFATSGIKYPDSKLKEVLEKYINFYQRKDGCIETEKPLTTDQLTGKCLITAYNMTTGKQRLFKNYAVKELNSDSEKHYKLSNFPTALKVIDVVQATSAAPTYLKSSRFRDADAIPNEDRESTFIDGGLIAGNPAMCALVDALKVVNNDPSRVYMLSIGTGHIVEDMDSKNRLDKWSKIIWATKVPSITMDGGQDLVNHQVKVIMGCPINKDISSNYARLDYPLEGRVMVKGKKMPYSGDMDNSTTGAMRRSFLFFKKREKEDNIGKLIHAGDFAWKTYYKHNGAELDELLLKIIKVAVDKKNIVVGLSDHIELETVAVNE